MTINMNNSHTRNRVVLVTIISALTIEVKTGMTVSRGVQPLAALKRDFGFKGRTKRQGLQFAVDTMIDMDPEYIMGRTTLLALQ